MKKIFSFLIFLISSTFIFAQAPQGINYQAVARDGDGNLLVDTRIVVQFDILSGTTDGPAVYSEVHEALTNTYGLFNLVIGRGVPESSTLADINWAADTYFLRVIVDGNTLGTTQFLSVPYALSVAPRKGIASVPGAVFYPNTTVASWYASVGDGGAEITEEGGPAVNVLDAPITLPHGARLTKFTAFFQDNSEEEMRIQLHRESLSQGIFSIVTEVRTDGAEPGWRSTTLDLDHIVDNERFGYLIRVFVADWNAQGTKAVKGVRVEYTY